jgi:hypothetical protein
MAHVLDEEPFRGANEVEVSAGSSILELEGARPSERRLERRVDPDRRLGLHFAVVGGQRHEAVVAIGDGASIRLSDALDEVLGVHRFTPVVTCCPTRIAREQGLM